MKTKLLKTLFVAAATMMGVSAWADTTAGTITKEMNYRTDDATPTKFSTIRESNSTNTQVEISYSSRFIAGMTLSIPEINNATEVTLKVTRVSGQTNKGDLNVWAFPYDLITESDFSSGTSQFCENVKTVLGVYPGTAPTEDPIGTVTTDDTSGYTQTVSFKGDALTALKNAGTITGGTLTVNIIATTKTSTQNFKWNAISASSDTPVLTVTFEKSSSEKTSVTTSTADTYVRLNNTTKQGSATAMEIHSEFTTDEKTSEKTYTTDFVGLMQFEIPAEAKTSDYEIESATLRLTTNMCKGATDFNIYSYSNAFDEANALYSTETSYIDAARKTTPLTFTAKYGSRTKALSDNQSESTSFKGAIENWTNSIDITSLVKAEASNKFQIMIDASTSDSKSAKFYTKEAEGFTNSATSVEYTTEQLIPQLTVVYKKKTPSEKTITVDRTTAEGSYGTICLPYAATAEGVVLLKMNGKTTDGNIQFDYVGEDEETSKNHALEAGVPYLYRATAAAQKFVATGTTETEAQTVNGFVGTYTKKDISQEVAEANQNTNLFLNTADNKWHPAGNYVELGAYKCYIPDFAKVDDATETPAGGNAKAGVVLGIYNGATAVSNVDANVNANNAQNGKFFKNGKLVIVKNGKQFNAAGAQVK